MNPPTHRTSRPRVTLVLARPWTPAEARRRWPAFRAAVLAFFDDLGPGTP